MKKIKIPTNWFVADLCCPSCKCTRAIHYTKYTPYVICSQCATVYQVEPILVEDDDD